VRAFAAGALLAMVADTLLTEAYEVGGVLTGPLVVVGSRPPSRSPPSKTPDANPSHVGRALPRIAREVRRSARRDDSLLDSGSDRATAALMQHHPGWQPSQL